MEDLKNTHVDEGNKSTQIENVETQTEDNNNQVKTFTQEEVNKIVQERLAREKGKNPNDEIEEREKNLISRELKVEAYESIDEMGLPKDVLELLDYSNKDNFDKSLELVKKTYEMANAEKKIQEQL